MPKRVFVCSPLRSETSEGYARNLQIARELTRAVLLAGHAPYTPHLWYSAHLDDSREDQRKLGMAAGAAWLRVADEIWVYAIDESECSSGMRAEVLAAGQFSLPVRVVWMPECFAEVRARHAVDSLAVEKCGALGPWSDALRRASDGKETGACVLPVGHLGDHMTVTLTTVDAVNLKTKL